jgi:nucleoside-diphosphate-sugar epimerase
MLIGNGMLASCFKKHLCEFNPNLLIFASGVSNSLETKDSEFNREIDLLTQCLQTSYYILYFSTCSIYDVDLIRTPYVQHKLMVEQLLRDRGKALIIRLPQIVGGGGNKNTLLNFLMNQIFAGNFFDVWKNAKRSLIDVEDVIFFTKKLVDHHIPNFSLINLAAPSNISIIDLINLIEKHTGLTARYNLIDIGSDYLIDITLLESLFDDYHEIFHQEYFESLVVKYCKKNIGEIS